MPDASLSPKFSACVNAVTFSGRRQLTVGERVERADRRHVELDVRIAAADARLLGELRHRVADRLVDPRAAEVDRHAADVHRVRAAADAAAALEDDVLDAGVPERVGEREAGPAGADDDHPVRVAGRAGRDLRRCRRRTRRSPPRTARAPAARPAASPLRPRRRDA